MTVSLINGEIADTPTLASDQVLVSVPNLNMLGRRTYGPLGFRPQISAEGGVRLPVRGDTALVAVDTEGPAWLVEWNRPDTTTPTANTLAGLGAGVSALPMDIKHYVGTVGEPAFQNSWVSYDGAAGPTGRAAAFWKDPFGVVRLSGVVRAGASPSVVFNLPPGYRPIYQTNDAHDFNVASAGTLAFANCGVLVNGDVVLTDRNAPGGGTSNVNSFCFLDGVAFATAQTTFPVAGLSPVPLAAALPGSPSNGQEVLYQNAAMLAQGAIWHLRYNSSGPLALAKWQCTGGTPIAVASQNTAAITSAAAYAYAPWPLAQRGVITVPLLGRYDSWTSDVFMQQQTAVLSESRLIQWSLAVPGAYGLAAGFVGNVGFAAGGGAAMGTAGGNDFAANNQICLAWATNAGASFTFGALGVTQFLMPRWVG